MTFTNEFLAELKSMALAVCPELAAEPLYILLGKRDTPRRKHVVAQATTTKNFGTRELAIESNRYDGPGRVIMFFGDEFDVDLARGICLHEIGHCLDFDVPAVDVAPTAEQSQFQEMAEYVAVTTPSDNAMPPWYPSHGATWLRRVLHLHDRAWRLGFEIPLPCVNVAGERYGLAPAWQFRSTLLDEFDEFRHRPLAAIEAAPAAAEFLKLFRESAAQFMRKQNANSNQK